MSVVVENLTKVFPGSELPALERACFTAPTGAITGVLGPSGGGKTTLLRLLAGLELPDGGRISVEGVDWTRVPVRARRVGLVFQSYALFKHMTVRENVAFGLKAQKPRLPRADIDARVRELLELVQLGELSERHPGQLSGGQQQRVAFARALAPRPALLLLDEPFGALDAHVRVELRRWLAELHERTKVTTLLVTHDQEEALEISQHVVVMQSGRVVQAGSPREIYDHPATPFVASFVGSANRLRGRVAGGRASVGPLSLELPVGAPSVEGAAVEAYVRPHDVRIRRPPGEGNPSGQNGVNGQNGEAGVELAVVVRLVRVGSFVKVELRLSSGDAMTVQMPADEADAVGVGDGDSVLVDLRAAKVFVEDYSI